MPYQKPKEDHPWRQYKEWFGDKPKRKLSFDEAIQKAREKDVRPVQNFLKDLIEGWDQIEVYTHAYGRTGKYRLTELSQYKVAAWIAGVLKRNYG